jgi:hypothetical protein
MCVIGYDDFKFGGETVGGFQIMNSWGPEWGKNGILPGCVTPMFDFFAKEAYAVYPQGEGVDVKPAASTSASDWPSGQQGQGRRHRIPLRNSGGRNVFRTTPPIRQGQHRFKIEVTNNAECYTYLFGQEADGAPMCSSHTPPSTRPTAASPAHACSPRTRA